MIVVVADESELEGAEEVVAAAIRDWTSEAGGIAVFRCHVPESRGGSVEVDALVCTPQGATVIEVKGFTARQDGTLATPPNGPWTVDGEEAALYHAVRVPNPFVQVRRQVFAAKNLLQQSGIFGWVNAVVVLVPQPGSRITLEESRIADGYRAVLMDRDDASALHDYFHAETGRTVRLSVNDVRRVFDALNLAHLLPSRVELADQGFPARLAPTTSSRPAPTTPEHEPQKEAATAPTGAASPLSIRSSAPAFLAAIDRLAHRPRGSSEPDSGTQARRSGTATAAGADGQSAGDGPDTIGAAEEAGPARPPTGKHPDTPAGSPSAEGNRAPLGTPAAQAAVATAAGAAVVAGAGARAADAEAPAPHSDATEPGPSGTDTPESGAPGTDDSADDSTDTNAAPGTGPGIGGLDPKESASAATTPGEPSGEVGPTEPGVGETGTAARLAAVAGAATAGVVIAGAEQPGEAAEAARDDVLEGGAVQAVETLASRTDSGTVGDHPSTGDEIAGHEAIPSESVTQQGAHSTDPTTVDPEAVSLTKSATPVAEPPGEPDVPTRAEFARDTASDEDSIDHDPADRGDPHEVDGSWEEPAHGGRSVAGTAAVAGLGAAAGAAGAAAWSSRSSSDPRPARQHETGEHYDTSEHWSQWVEQDRSAPRRSVSSRVRERVGRRSSGPSLLERWRNTPVRERRRRQRRWVRIGPGVGLILFIVLFGAGFFAITAVNASRFEMSDYDRMCGDRKPFPNAAEYQRDGARPIYLSGELATMVATNQSSAWRPTDTSAVQLIACMTQVSLGDLVVTCQYPPAPGEPIGRTVNLFRATYEVTVYELRTGREVARATMVGERYSADPANTDPDRCRGAADAPDYLGRRLGQPSTAQVTGFLAPLVHADR